MKVPTYQNQVSPGRINAAEPRTGAPVREAFGADVALAASNFGQGAQRLAAGISASAERALTRQKNLRMTAAQLNWQKDNDELLNGKLNPQTGERIEGGLLTKEYSDANGIAKEYLTKGRQLMQKHLADIQDPKEREDLALYFQKDLQDNFDHVARYQLKQQRDTETLLTNSFNENALRKIQANPEELSVRLGEMTQKTRQNWASAGMPKEMQDLQQYVLNGQAVSAAVASFLNNKQTQKAAEVLNLYKNDIQPAVGRELAKQVRDAAMADIKNDFWGVVSVRRTPTGEVDLAYAQEVLAAAGYDEQMAGELMQDAQDRMKNEKIVNQQARRANDELFYTQADKMVNENATLESTMALAAKYANDGKDKFTKERFIRSLYEEKSSSYVAKSNPEEYLRLWKGIQEGTLGEEDVKDSFNQKLLNATDYRALVKDCYASGDEKQGRAFAIKQIEADAKRKISDADDRVVFMLEVKRQSMGKTPEEMVSIAASLLQKSGGWFSKKNYEQTAQLSLEQQRVMGDYMRAYPQGAKYVKMISAAVKQEHEDVNYPWAEADLDAWTKRYGASRLFMQGTPENEAMEWMIQNKMVPTTQDMEYVINYFYEQRGEKSPAKLQKAAEQEKNVKNAAGFLRSKKEVMREIPFANPDMLEENNVI